MTPFWKFILIIIVAYPLFHETDDICEQVVSSVLKGENSSVSLPAILVTIKNILLYFFISGIVRYCQVGSTEIFDDEINSLLTKLWKNVGKKFLEILPNRGSDKNPYMLPWKYKEVNIMEKKIIEIMLQKGQPVSYHKIAKELNEPELNVLDEIQKMFNKKLIRLKIVSLSQSQEACSILYELTEKGKVFNKI